MKTGLKLNFKIFIGLMISPTFLISTSAMASVIEFPDGTATPSEMCGTCHKAIYKEFAFGFGGDIQYKDIILKSDKDRLLNLPSTISGTATAHAFSGVDPFPIHARNAEEEGESCNACHFPDAFVIPDISTSEIAKPKSRTKEKETGGLTCACCHLTPDGKIRGAYEVQAPHKTSVEPNIQTSAMCAYCHSLGERVIGKQTQTFLEWRDDFNKPGLGRQHCQECHMPRTIRKAAEETGIQERAVARHLWMGGRSRQRLESSLGIITVQPEAGLSGLEFHLINIGAGHSVPSGSNRRAIYLIAEIIEKSGRKIASNDWMLAPWFANRPDDKKFVEEDNTLPSSVASIQADSQGPHEAIIRAGEERILRWNPELKKGDYIINARLVYDLNRFNDRNFSGDRTEFNRAICAIKVK
jgi:hypothetical protein